MSVSYHCLEPRRCPGARPIGVPRHTLNPNARIFRVCKKTPEIAEWHVIENSKGGYGVGARGYIHGLRRRSCFYLGLASNTHWTPEELFQKEKLT